MPSLDPRHVFHAMRDKTRLPNTEAERSLFVLMHGGAELTKLMPYRPWTVNDVIDPSVAYPFNVFREEATRTVLDAFLLTGADDHLIADALSMPADEVGVYKQLFFDTSVFRTDIEIIIFIKDIPEDNEYKGMYRIAFHQGLGALQWHFCRNKGQVDPTEVISTIMTDTYYRSLEHRGQAITSKTAKEAAKLARLSLDCARTLRGEDTASPDQESLRIKFEQVRKNRTAQELASQSNTEILH